MMKNSQGLARQGGERMVSVIRWRDLIHNSVKQCAFAPPGNNYDTLCGLALHDLEEDLGEAQILNQDKSGKVTCDKCKMVINHVLKNYAGKR